MISRHNHVTTPKKLWENTKQKTAENRGFTSVFGSYGGDKRDRTADLLNAIQALSQLSYTPIFLAAC